MTRPWRGNMGGCIMHSLLTLSCYEPRIPNGSSCQALSNKGPLGLEHSQPPISVVRQTKLNLELVSILTTSPVFWQQSALNETECVLQVGQYWIWWWISIGSLVNTHKCSLFPVPLLHLRETRDQSIECYRLKIFKQGATNWIKRKTTRSKKQKPDDA